MVDYKAVVEQLQAWLKSQQASYKRGEMMSLSEMVQGEIQMNIVSNKVEQLIEANTGSGY